MDRSSHQKESRDDDTGDPPGAGGSCALLSLGTDQLLAILQYLPVPSVLAFGMTCRRCREIADSEGLWALLCKREWGSWAVDAWPSESNRKTGWKSLHRQMLGLGSILWYRLHQGDIVPAARASHSMVTLAGKVAVFGGGYDGGRHLDDTWITSIGDDPSQNIIWQPASLGIPSGRFGQSCTVVEDTLVLFGGINDHGIRQCDTWINRGIHVASNEERPSWQLLEVAAAPCARGAHAGCYAGDRKVVVFGGIGSDGVRLKDTWVLDLSEKPLPMWREVITLRSPSARSGHTLTWVGGKRMVLFGGRGTKFEVLNDVWLLDMEGEFPNWVELRADELHPLHEYPLPCAGHSATLIFGGRVLIYGGEDARRGRKGDVWVLDISAGIPVGNGSCMNRFQNRSRDSGNFARKFWKKMKQRGQTPSKRSFHGACSMHSGHAVLVFGGMVDGELMPAAAAGLGFDSELFMLQLV